MAGRISELDPITAAALTLADDFEVRDIDDPEMSPLTGTNHALPLGELILFLQTHMADAGLVVDDVPPADTSVLWADTTEQGSAANSVLAGTVAPTAGDGNDGDFWIDSVAWMIYGPKDDGAWPAGVSMTGGGGGGGITEAAADLRYVNVTGDTINGTLTVTGGDIEVTTPGEVHARAFAAWGDDSAESIFMHLGCDTLYVNESLQTYTPIWLASTGNVPTDPRHATSKGYVDQQDALRQPIDADLTAIAALAPADNTVMQRKAGAWVASTPATVKTDLAIASGDVSGLGALATATVPITVAQGGSGRATATTAYGLLAAGTTATGAQQTVSPAASGFLKTTSTTALPAWAALTKTDVGLANVDNTADTAKPVSTAQQTALDLKVDKTLTISTTAPLTIDAGASANLSANRTLAVAAATAAAVGVVELATTLEATAGTDTTRAITAAGLTAHVDNRGFITSAAANSAYINVSGDTMTGALTLAFDPGSPMDAATKQYVDAKMITVASTAPSSPAVNDLWVDTT